MHAEIRAAEDGCLTYQARQLPAPEAHADANVEAVGVGEALVALRHCDVDGGGQEDGHVHRDHGPGPGTDPTVGNENNNKKLTKKAGLRGEKRKQQTDSPQQHHAVRHERPDGDV